MNISLKLKRLIYPHKSSKNRLCHIPLSHGFTRFFSIQATQDPQTFLKPGVHAGLTEAGGSLRNAKLIT